MGTSLVSMWKHKPFPSLSGKAWGKVWAFMLFLKCATRKKKKQTNKPLLASLCPKPNELKMMFHFVILVWFSRFFFWFALFGGWKVFYWLVLGDPIWKKTKSLEKERAWNVQAKPKMRLQNLDIWCRWHELWHKGFQMSL